MVFKFKLLLAFNTFFSFLWSFTFRFCFRHFVYITLQDAYGMTPKVLYVRVTTHVRLAVERSRCSRASVTRRQSSARYSGEMPDSDWCTSVATLKSTRWRTGSQCSWQSTGDMWSERRVPVTRRAAAFWTDCSRFISPSEMPKNSELE